jgi:hypothetical protein
VAFGNVDLLLMQNRLANFEKIYFITYLTFDMYIITNCEFVMDFHGGTTDHFLFNLV